MSSSEKYYLMCSFVSFVAALKDCSRENWGTSRPHILTLAAVTEKVRWAFSFPKYVLDYPAEPFLFFPFLSCRQIM